MVNTNSREVARGPWYSVLALGLASHKIKEPSLGLPITAVKIIGRGDDPEHGQCFQWLGQPWPLSWALTCLLAFTLVSLK